MKILIDTLAYTNRLRWLPPEQKLMFASTLLMIAAFSHPLVQVLIAVWISIWTVVYAGIPAKTYIKLLYLATFFWLTSLPALALNGVDISQVHLVSSDAVNGLTFGSYYVYIRQFVVAPNDRFGILVLFGYVVIVTVVAAITKS